MQYPDLLPGDILLSRNLGDDEENNATPGYWNHSGIYVGNDRVVEAQSPPWGGKVLLSHKIEYFQRYPYLVVKRHVQPHKDPEAGNVAANEAIKSVGVKYRKLASLFRRLRSVSKGENCVSVVRRGWAIALGEDPRWVKPDDIYNDTDFEVVYQQQDEADNEMET